MMNTLLLSRAAGAALAIAMLVYLASCIPPLILSLRCYLDFALAGPRAGFKWSRFVTLTGLIVVVPLSLAWHNPALSEVAFSLTGATGVCVVCYVIPIVAHFRLMFAKSLETRPELSEDGAGLLDVLSSYARDVDEEQAARRYLDPPASFRQVLLHVVRPLAVLVLGVVLSAMAIWHAFV
jgi:Transmembrane amino acid transporter protein